ncbi:hypothetical protein SAMN05421805_11447 [Saccharopolyspora antimicrobica]|uniref:TRASH domain-containing protein n=2 Tax=Saccharopolyspora antimicrobica TaxID=455193 RepID=A0A1I5H0X8_9PSEU|nr:hypothetical protein ATL45_0014 [Saccharopolyspora antimicrobica]SFO41491.1 hypothetical protein SAMN05421805_11447 [Saccharopolyspora antimicrobica]
MFVELFAPKGSLSADQRRQVAELLGSPREFVPEAERHAGITEVFGSLFHVVVHEPEVWVAGGQVLEPGGPAQYVVRVHVPGPWRKEMSEFVISWATKALATVIGDAARPYQEPVVQVHVLGVPEGGIGLLGEVARSARIVEMMGEPYRADLAAGRAVEDPLCGVIVPLDDAAITLEVDGQVHAFCCAGCRDQFAAKLG